jgi:AcrR family transcriptional regulator
MMPDAQTDGRDRRSDRTRTAILHAARERFAAQGYDRTTIRGVAADADIDPSMVMRYFGNKAQLFEAALTIDLRLPDLAAVPHEELPAVLVRHFVDRWEGDPTDDALLVLLRSAVTNEQAAARTHEIFASQVAPALSAALGREVAGRAVVGELAAHAGLGDRVVRVQRGERRRWLSQASTRSASDEQQPVRRRPSLYRA